MESRGRTDMSSPGLDRGWSLWGGTKGGVWAAEREVELSVQPRKAEPASGRGE